MPDLLDGARLKVVRAEQHLDSLNSGLRRYLDGKPYEVVVANPYPNDPTFWRATATLASEPPPILACILGDCVTNVRAALDYIVWELGVRYAEGSSSSRDDRKLFSFPIYADPSDQGYVDKIKRLSNRSIPAGAISEIQAVQPHHTGYESLSLLHSLVNKDKHREPLFAVGAVDRTLLLQGDDVFGETLLVISAGAEAEAYDSTNGPDVEMYGHATVFVTWQDVAMPREPVDRTLENIIKCVADIIPRFEPFLS